MINWIAEKLGYIKKDKIDGFRNLSTNPFSEEELSFMLATLLKDEEDFNDEEEKKIFKRVKEVEGFVEYLRNSAHKDMVRYFGATNPEEQLIIRGAFARTNYLKARISSDDKEKKTKLEGVRYG